MNKRLLVGLSLLLTLALLLGPALAQDEVPALPDLEGRVIQAVTENLFPPLNLEHPVTAEGVGWEYDAIEEICDLLNCVVEWSLISFDVMIESVGDGQFDVGMDGITIREDRDEIVDFSDPYMTLQQFILVRADEDRFADAAGLGADPELLIGAQPGTTPFYTAVYEVLDGDEANPRVVLFDNFFLQTQALAQGSIDAVIMDGVGAQGVMGTNPGAFKMLPEALTSEDFGFIFPNGSDLVAPFNAALSLMRDSGYLDYLNAKWFDRYLPVTGGFRAS
jgi:polar amino acid transport system substrate-binding protein